MSLSGYSRNLDEIMFEGLYEDLYKRYEEYFIKLKDDFKTKDTIDDHFILNILIDIGDYTNNEFTNTFDKISIDPSVVKKLIFSRFANVIYKSLGVSIDSPEFTGKINIINLFYSFLSLTIKIQTHPEVYSFSYFVNYGVKLAEQELQEVKQDVSEVINKVENISISVNVENEAKLDAKRKMMVDSPKEKVITAKTKNKLANLFSRKKINSKKEELSNEKNHVNEELI